MIFAKLGFVIILFSIVGCTPIAIKPQPDGPLTITGQPIAPKVSDYQDDEEKQYIHDLQKYMYDMMIFVTKLKRRNGDHDYVYHEFVLPEIEPPPQAPRLEINMPLSQIEQIWKLYVSDLVNYIKMYRQTVDRAIKAHNHHPFNY